MKIILTFLFAIYSFSASGQSYQLYYKINFDTSNGFYQHYPYFHDSIFLNYRDLLNIDTINYHHNQWQVGRPHKTIFNSSFSLPNAIVTDTTNSCIPNDTSVFVMKVSKHAWLDLCAFSFKFRLDIDSGDIAKVEVSSDTGQHWINILTDTTGLFNYPSPKPDFSLSTIGWDSFCIAPSSFGLFSPTTIDSFLFRFTFIADSNSRPRDGWMIDDIVFGYMGENVPILPTNNSNINIYPNPAKNELNITSTNRITSIIITNLLGQAIFKQNYNTDKITMDISEFTKGIYFIKVNGTEDKVFLKD